MNKSDWQQYLLSQQAHFSTANELFIESFAATNSHATAFVTPLLFQGLLSVDGPDGAKFLQGTQ